MIVSVISYGYMLGSIAASLTNTASAYSAFKEKMSAIKVYLKVKCLQIFFLNLINYDYTQDNKVDSVTIKKVTK